MDSPMDKPPPSLRRLLPYINLGNQHRKKDPIVAYYLFYHAVNECLAVSKSDPSAKAYALSLLDKLENMKVMLRGREEISNDVVGQVYVENAAMRLFCYADSEDRNAKFHMNMKKAFYASAFIFETLKVFGEVSDEVEEKRKYAKWKAVDIDKCLKNGITPTPGPPGGGDDSEFGNLGMGMSGGMGSGPPSGMGSGPPGGMGSGPPGGMGSGPPGGMGSGPPGGVWMGYPSDDPNLNLPPGGSDLYPSGGGYEQEHSQPVPKPRSMPPPSDPSPISSSSSSGSRLTPQQLERVTKLCRFAISSLDYEDQDGAIDNLTKALNLLKTGKE